jgi:hypothetical protein
MEIPAKYKIKGQFEIVLLMIRKPFATQVAFNPLHSKLSAGGTQVFLVWFGLVFGDPRICKASTLAGQMFYLLSYAPSPFLI